ncbi:MAG: HTTM domain-containing protein [Bdellovibrio sp.]|nr:HTTM domain-containing protein [Bdellovibrio sp.]
MIKKLWSYWENFWFAPQNLLGLAYMRIMLCGTLFYMTIMRFYNLWFFTDASWIPREKALAILPELGRPLFSWNFWPDSMNLPINILGAVLFLLLTLGIGGRAIMWLSWVIYVGFMHRDYPVHFGADVIGSLFLFYMSFTNSCERLSVLNLLKKKTTFKEADILSSMMIRMMQVQIMVIYAYTGWEKLKGASWWDGTAMWSVLANPQMTTFDFTFLRAVPWVLPIIGFTTIIFEVYFPPMVIWNKSRYIWLLMGVSMHLGIGLFMGLMPFATVMMATYFLFIDPKYLNLRKGMFQT